MYACKCFQRLMCFVPNIFKPNWNNHPMVFFEFQLHVSFNITRILNTWQRKIKKVCFNLFCEAQMFYKCSNKIKKNIFTCISYITQLLMLFTLNFKLHLLYIYRNYLLKKLKGLIILFSSLRTMISNILKTNILWIKYCKTCFYFSKRF